MRAQVVGVGLLALSFAVGVACIPDPAGDFEDFGERMAPYQQAASDGGGTFDGAPPTEAATGLYYGACLTQLAFGQPNLVFNFIADTSFVPEGGSGRLSLKITPLRTGGTGKEPPATVSRAGAIGETYGIDLPAAPNVTPEGKYQIPLGLVTVPGEANPITGRNVLIENAVLTGRFATQAFCARLSGQVTQPISLTLEPPRNVCQFVPITDGAPTPKFTDQAQFAPETCPE